LFSVANIPDIQFVYLTGLLKIPLLGTEAPITTFFRVTPLLLFSVYIYFFTSLLCLERQTSKLPAIFDDGLLLTEISRHWPLGLVFAGNNYFLRQKRDKLDLFLILFGKAFLYCLLPLTLMILWLVSAKAHDSIILFLIPLLLFISLILPLWNVKRMTFLESFPARITLRLIHFITLIALPSVLFWAGVQLMHGNRLPFSLTVFYINAPYENIAPNTIITSSHKEKHFPTSPKRLSLTYSNFSNANLSNSIISNIDFENINIKGINLDSSTLNSVKMKKVSASGSMFNQVETSEFVFRDSNCSNCFFIESTLINANLINSDFSSANFSNADLMGSTATGAHFQNTIFNQANLASVNFTKAKFIDTRAISAHFLKAKFTQSSFKGSQNLLILSSIDFSCIDFTGSTFENVAMVQINLTNSTLNNTKFISIDLSNGDLRGSHLRGSVFEDVNMSGVELNGAYLQGADLRGTFGLTVSQLESAHIAGALLPANITPN
jgi:uncharacterized protein YjbI with pentapeptide repeats